MVGFIRPGRILLTMFLTVPVFMAVLRNSIFLVVGLVFWAVAGYLFNARTDFLAQAQSALGVVSELNAGGSHPQIDFVTADEQHISYPQGGFIFGYQEKQQVQVWYLPAQPFMTAVVQDRGALWGTPIALTVLGLIFCGVGGFGLVRLKRNTSNNI